VKGKIRISPVGRLSKGFSLLELIVVLALMGLILAFTIPRIHQVLSPNNLRKAAAWLVAQSTAARARAAASQIQHSLHLDLGEKRLWVTDASLSQEAALAARKNAFRMDQNVRIREVAFPERTAVSSGTTAITFYPDGHADPAWIRLEDSAGLTVSLFIEPFLPRIRWHHGDYPFSE